MVVTHKVIKAHTNSRLLDKKLSSKRCTSYRVGQTPSSTSSSMANSGMAFNWLWWLVRVRLELYCQNIQLAKHGLSYIAVVGNRELILFIALEPSLAVNHYLMEYMMAMERNGNATGRNTRDRRTTQSAPG